MVGAVAEIKDRLSQGKENLAVAIVDMYRDYELQRRTWMEEVKEARSFTFATSTTDTLGVAGSTAPWKHTTTLPKLCQIRDNLHANYMSALYPNDDWLQWIAEEEDGLDKEKATAVTAYMSNKLRQMGFRQILSDLVYDYIDYGNAIGGAEFVNITTKDETGNEIPIYVGPRIYRISPLDLVMNPLAKRFADTPKIFRELISVGELLARAEDEPDNREWLMEAYEKVKDRRATLAPYRATDINKAAGLQVDGFGSFSEYLESGYVEVFNFVGDIYDTEQETLLRNHTITVVDRDYVVRKEPNPSWLGESYYEHVGWRERPDNLYAQGPLNNLIGMQYRIDHEENMKADVRDLIAAPPLKLRGNVESWEWGPWAEILLGDDGDVDILKVDSAIFNSDTQIFQYMQLMEEMAGAPKQSIGARTPGEKTAFEVQTLEQNAGKMFQEKILHFEINFLEPLLNKCLELARRHLDGGDLVRVMDDDQGIQSFISVTAEDLKAKGRIRPVAARNFAQRAQNIQNLQGALAMVQADPGIRNHLSGKSMAQLVETGLNLQKYNIYRPNVQIDESMESQALANAANQVLQEENQTPTNEEF